MAPLTHASLFRSCTVLLLFAAGLSLEPGAAAAIAVDAATFVSPCRDGQVVVVAEDTVVSGAAQVDGPCTISIRDARPVVEDSLLTTGYGHIAVTAGMSSADLRRSRLITPHGSVDVNAYRDVTVADNDISAEEGSVRVYTFQALTFTDNDVSASYDVVLTAQTGAAQVDHNRFQALNLELLVREGECTSEFNEPEIVCQP